MRSYNKDAQPARCNELAALPQNVLELEGTIMASATLPTQYNFRNLTGQVFGRLTVIEYTGANPTRWLCSCDCGNVKAVPGINLTIGKTKSCGCLNRELASSRAAKHRLKHTVEYHSWCSLIGRCTNPQNNSFMNYGGRGITVCDRWRNSFLAFLEDMGNRPSLSHSIDRIDNDRGYEPGNCRWATRTEQVRNRRTSIIIEFRGETKSLMEWSQELGIKFHTLYNRVFIRGMTFEQAVTTPVRKITSQRASL